MRGDGASRLVVRPHVGALAPGAPMAGLGLTLRDGTDRTAAEAIGPITPGCRVFTVGTFAPLSILAHVLGQVGTAHVDVVSWTVGRSSFVEAALWRAGPIRRLRMVTDRSLPSRNPAYYATLTDLYGPASVAFAKLHAKWMVVRSVDGRWSLAVLTSANFDEVRSAEFYLVADDPALASHLSGLVDGYFAAGEPVAATEPGRAGDGALAVDVRRAGWSWSRSGEVLA